MQKWIYVCRNRSAPMLMGTLVLLAIANPAWANDPVASDAIRALRALNAATTAGLDKTEYQRRMIDTKVLIEEYLESPSAGDSEIRMIVGRSMRLYELAGRAWADQIAGARRDLPGGIEEEIYQRLLTEVTGTSQAACEVLRKKVSDGLEGHARRHPSYKDSTIVAPGFGFGLVPTIWGCAGEEVKAASALRVTSTTGPTSGRAMSAPPAPPAPAAVSPTTALAPSGTTSRATHPVGTIGLTMASGNEPTPTYLGQFKMVLGGKWFPTNDDSGRKRVAVVLVNLDRDGRIKGVMLEKASGHATFDELALRAVTECKRGPALSPVHPEETVLVRATFAR